MPVQENTTNRPPGITLLEDKLWLAVSPTGLKEYDFAFEDFFHCRHPHQLTSEITAVARMGAAQDYSERYKGLLTEFGIRLIHTPEDYLRTSLLPNWYPLIEEYTPKSVWFEKPPTAEEVSAQLAWPVFLKGERQTSKHAKSLSVAHDDADFTRIMEQWKLNPILWWQRVVCREFIPLQPAVIRSTKADDANVLQKSFEFRSFWWKTYCVGIGRYWVAESYRLPPEDETAILQIGRVVAERIGVTFLVIDFAKTAEGKWLVIEVNDGQDSGYAGVNPRMLWTKIIELI